MEKSREEQAFDLLKEAFPDKTIVLGIDDDDDSYIGYVGSNTSMVALIAALAVNIAEATAEKADSDPVMVLKTIIKTIEKGAELAWDLQTDSES